ncbi:MAG: 3-oxoacyl-[acyl-carrier-protein] reductase [Clostridiales bacterium]|nr:3-oxoacyl-[acyl-carrier-protein] reductase [Clostridiales bacterium]
MDLLGRVALVTGASRGIGRAIAIRLARLGTAVAVNYSSNIDAANEVVNTIESNGGKALLALGDVSDPKQVNSIIESVMEKWGTLDILVNNAGITRDGLLIRMKEEDWDRVVDISLKGVFNCTKAVSRIMMKKRWGRIINISSIAGVAGNIGQTNYAAAKAGVIGFSKSVAKELASRNILVNVIAPGFIDTDMTDALPEEVRKSLLSNIPLGRYGDPEDVASLAAFLASEYSSYITGQVINIDGGMVM